jgi:hypothetical protein
MRLTLASHDSLNFGRRQFSKGSEDWQQIRILLVAFYSMEADAAFCYASELFDISH